MAFFNLETPYLGFDSDLCHQMLRQPAVGINFTYQ